MSEEEAKAPKVRVKGARQNLEKKTRNPRLKKSTFHLTINTNQQYKEDDPNLENDISVFEDTIEEILQNIGDYVHIKGEDGDTWDGKVESADIDFVVERGLKKGQIHAHILLQFKHRTKLLLNYEKIKEKLREQLGVDCYMLNRLVNNGSSNVEDYINKYV
jgi:hypothetical protein